MRCGKNKKKYKILTCSPQQVFVSFHDQHNVEISTARINVQHQSSLRSALCCVNGVLHLLHRGRSGKAFTEVTEVISVMVRFLTWIFKSGTWEGNSIAPMLIASNLNSMMRHSMILNVTDINKSVYSASLFSWVKQPKSLKWTFIETKTQKTPKNCNSSIWPYTVLDCVYIIWCLYDQFGSCVWTNSTEFLQWLYSSPTNHPHPIL